MVVGIRLGMVVFDTPDPEGLARFWSALLGWDVDAAWSSDDWMTLRRDGETPLAFQLAPELPRPTWPNPDVAQQAHLDVFVTDLDAALARALELGATPLEPAEANDHLAVLADPSGHPFCLCLLPEDS